MTNETSARGRMVMAAIALIAGILLVTWVPTSILSAMDSTLKGAVAKVAASNNPLFAPAPTLITFFFPFWGALCVVAGAALLVLVYPIYRGERWARHAAVGLLTIPSITGAMRSALDVKSCLSLVPSGQASFHGIVAAECALSNWDSRTNVLGSTNWKSSRLEVVVGPCSANLQ